MSRISSKKLSLIIVSTFLVSTTLPVVTLAKTQPIDHSQLAMYQLISDHNGNDNGNSNNGGGNGNSNGNGNDNGNDNGGNGNGNGNGNWS